MRTLDHNGHEGNGDVPQRLALNEVRFLQEEHIQQMLQMTPSPYSEDDLRQYCSDPLIEGVYGSAAVPLSPDEPIVARQRERIVTILFASAVAYQNSLREEVEITAMITDCGINADLAESWLVDQLKRRKAERGWRVITKNFEKDDSEGEQFYLDKGFVYDARFTRADMCRMVWPPDFRKRRRSRSHQG
ncbi:MAG: hypothetical protein Q7R81_02035 [Candidatus Peregrinibacteria bacterium]|nr:hypothetical protein [Candidatus Peregrinibacteria bacterium]